MRLALAEALAAATAGEVPVGAVVVKDGLVIGSGRNAPIGAHDPTAHAEIVALRAAARHLGNYRLDGCTLYVTLEPCAMCGGAMLHARLARVVYGVPDPKTGAAGSVLNLFGEPRLNHQTRVEALADADLAAACGALLTTFFKEKRVSPEHPLREDALRTPRVRLCRFARLPLAAPLPERPAEPGRPAPALPGRRAGRCAAHLAVPARQSGLELPVPQDDPGVCSALGDRVVAPDLIGFGKSDKPKKDSFHTFSGHRQVLLEFIERLDLKNVVLVVQDWGGLLGLTLPMAAPQRYQGLLVMNTTLATGDAPLSPGFVAWREMCAKNPEFDVGRLFARGNPQMSADECAAYNAPFPDRGHRAALRAFPPMVPDGMDSDGAAISRAARDFWRDEWTGQTLMAIGAQDPVLGEPVMRALQQVIRGCPEPMLLPQAGHFVQEHGEAIATAALAHFTTR